jgi:predicted nuclease of predicted toxin-antitoxin system
MKRVLLDQGLPPEAAALLRNEGWDAIHVREIGLASASDTEILGRARVERRVCVTLDRDFHAHLAMGSARQPSVVLLRWEGLHAGPLRDLLLRVWAQVEPHLSEGVAVTVSERSVRFRRLPLRPTTG